MDQTQIKDSSGSTVESMDCPICLEPVSSKGVSTTRCGHTFCLRCLAKHMSRNNGCPMCRGEILPPNDVPQVRTAFNTLVPAFDFQEWRGRFLRERVETADTNQIEQLLELDSALEASQETENILWRQLQHIIVRYGQDAGHRDGTRAMASFHLIDMIMSSGDVEEFADSVANRITDHIAAVNRQREYTEQRLRQLELSRRQRTRREERRSADQEAGRVVGATIVFLVQPVGAATHHPDTAAHIVWAARRELKLRRDGSDDNKSAVIRKVMSVNMDVEIQDETHRILRINKQSAYYRVSQN
jgi:hypothetical protein